MKNLSEEYNKLHEEKIDEAVSVKDAVESFDLNFVDKMDGEVFRLEGRNTKKGLKSNLTVFFDSKPQQFIAVSDNLDKILSEVGTLAHAAGQSKLSSILQKARDSIIGRDEVRKAFPNYIKDSVKGKK